MDIKYSIGLNVLLKHLAIQSLLDHAKQHVGLDLENMKKIFSSRDFALGCQEEYPEYSYNGCENIYLKFSGVLASCDETKNKRNVFYLFHKIASEALRLENNGVYCKHSELVSWRDTVHSAGQSVFICAFLAYEDVQSLSYFLCKCLGAIRTAPVPFRTQWRTGLTPAPIP